MKLAQQAEKFSYVLVFGVRLAQQAQSVVKGGFGEACTASSKVKLGLLLKGCHASPCV